MSPGSKAWGGGKSNISSVDPKVNSTDNVSQSHPSRMIKDSIFKPEPYYRNI